MDIEKEIQHLKQEFHQDLLKIIDENSFTKTKIKYLGKKGIIKSLYEQLKTIPAEQKPLAGKEINLFRQEIEEILNEKFQQISFAKSTSGKNDLTLPGKNFVSASLHPITQLIEEIKEIFSNLNFQIVEGNEVETNYYNFDALNIPLTHPARDIEDTFYITSDVLLRTHTSPVQIHVMEKSSPPIHIISLGKCYRRDEIDSSHTPNFHQVEGLYVDKEVSFAHLKGIITVFVQKMFGSQMKLRFRPSFFPFTEPSAEVDIQCSICKGKGCSACKNTGWMEILGCGMVNQQVFINVGYDRDKYTGFAFGMGIERIAMIKYGIDDIRLFFQNNLDFLRQF